MSVAGKNMSSRLRHRLTLQQEVQTSDTEGGYTKSWQSVTDLWGEIISLGNTNSKFSKSTGRKFLFADQLHLEATHKILLRYRDGMTAAMRLIFENRAFNIIYVVDPEQKREMLELLVEEGVAT